jgi:hypothetical protein
MTTRQSSKADFDHVIKQVLDRDDNSPLKQALVKYGYKDIHALVMLEEVVIPALTYDIIDDTLEFPVIEEDIPILPFEKALVSMFLEYIINRDDTGDPIRDDWLLITKAYQG